MKREKLLKNSLRHIKSVKFGYKIARSALKSIVVDYNTLTVQETGSEN